MSHAHGHEDLTPEQFRALFEQPSWEERYAAQDAVWSGNPNPQLVAEVTGPAPGRALDVGSGEGADVIWLAAHGWQATGLDFSRVALERAAAHAESAGVADRVRWQHGDVRTFAEPASYDLVSSQYMHLPDGGMLDVVRRLAAAVAPGGTLLVVGHHPRDRETGLRWSFDGVAFTPEDLAPALDPDAWDVRTDVRERSAVGPEGDPVTVRDSVVRATRR
jgi:SAM-dependent methyltransferase